MPLEFNAPAGDNLFDKAKVVGKSTPRIDGPRKTTGTAPYAYERHDVAPNQAYGYIVGAGIGKGRIISMDASRARAAPGVLAVITAPETKPVGTSNWNNAPLFGGPEVAHYHQAIACVVAETFEQARAAAALIRTRYERGKGRFDFPDLAPSAPLAKGRGGKPDRQTLGDFDTAYASAAVKLDETYHTSDESHSMMEPHATIAAWEGDTLTLWTANQMIDWARQGMAAILGIDPAKVRVDSPYIGGGFGGKLFIRADAVLAALAAKQVGRPVKIALQRPLVPNNTTHRHATLQRVRIGCGKDGRISAIAHENWSGNINGEDGENGTLQPPKLYAGATRLVANYIATLDMPEGNAMRAPGEAPGHMALEVAMDEMAEKLGLDPIAFRILNEPEVVPGDPSKKFSDRNLVRCLREGAERFNWNKRNPRPAQVREGDWLVGMGVSAGYRGAPTMKSAARVRLDGQGGVIVETDMTDIGTGSYTIIAQTAAETMGVPLERVQVTLGDSRHPASAGSGGQWGAASSTAGVYAACGSLRRKVGETGLRRRHRRLRQWPHPGGWADHQAGGGGHTVGGGRHCLRRLQARLRRRHLCRAFLRGRRACLHGRDAHSSHACRMRWRPDPQSAVCTQPGHRGDGDGCGRDPDGGAGGRQTAWLVHQPRPGRLRGSRARRHPVPGGGLPRHAGSGDLADEGQGCG